MKRILPVVSFAALAVAGLLLYQARSRQVPQASPAPSSVSGEEALRQEIEKLKQELAELRETPAVESPTPRPGGKSEPQPAGTSPAELLRLIEEKDRELAAQGQALADLRAKLAEFEQQLSATREQQIGELKRREAEMAELSSKLEMASKASTQAQADLEIRNKRLLQLEADLRKQTEEARKQAARIKQVFDDMDSLSRRREAFMNNIQLRYREATDLFRALSLRLDSMRDGTAAAGNELSRIQNAVSLAEEDMRQLRALHTRATQLQKDLATATQTPKRP
ncbi:MAG: hypothetical protein JNL62_12150 [Bryobacterales bacterium]|nr:hypothetical protein [Bryobacterales bacterium]